VKSQQDGPAIAARAAFSSPLPALNTRLPVFFVYSDFKACSSCFPVMSFKISAAFAQNKLSRGKRPDFASCIDRYFSLLGSAFLVSLFIYRGCYNLRNERSAFQDA